MDSWLRCDRHRIHRTWIRGCVVTGIEALLDCPSMELCSNPEMVIGMLSSISEVDNLHVHGSVCMGDLRPRLLREHMQVNAYPSGPCTCVCWHTVQDAQSMG